jgi:hypothetical protein
VFMDKHSIISEHSVAFYFLHFVNSVHVHGEGVLGKDSVKLIHGVLYF